MFDHVTIRVSDREASERFYGTVLRTLGIEKDYSDDQARDARPPRGLPRAVVDRFWRAGTEAGQRDDGPPGPRPEYGEDHYGVFLLDPDVWMRVADVSAAKRFYGTVAPFAGFRLADDTPDRVRFAGAGGCFSVVSGRHSEHVRMAFPAPDNATVEAFHGALTQAGYRDSGAPGERAAHHPGYYGAFVLDPDGNNAEVLCQTASRASPRSHARSCGRVPRS